MLARTAIQHFLSLFVVASSARIVLAADDAVLSPASPDLIFHHGRILTVDPAFRAVEAMAVRGERIVAVGTNEEVRKLAGKETKLVDLAGKTVLPGLIDTHTHTPAAATFEFDHPVPHMETIADVLAYVKSRAAALKKGEWIRIQQVFITRLREQRFPTRQELDEAAPEHPVALPHRARRLAQLAGPETQRHRQGFPDHRRQAGPRRARRGHGRADGHSAQLRPLHQVPLARKGAHGRRPPRVPRQD